MDYKSTLNLPKTSFPMKGNLPQTEPKVLARWEEEKLWERIQERRQDAQPFILHDGPPYANGNIHMGHALNKVLKDVIVRYHTMRGKRSPYVPGWDCHGLPIEYSLMKEMKVTKHQVKIAEFRKKAREYAHKYVRIQRDEFKRLGVMGDWEHPYLTLEPGYVAAALRTLAELVSKGFIVRDRKPVNWCWSCETALAEAEVEYEPHTSPSVYVKFPLTAESADVILSLPKGPQNDVSSSRIYLVIWTTTPWTLMGNVAVAVHPDFNYAVRRVGPNEEWIVLSELPENAQVILRESGGSGDDIRKILPGRELEGLTYTHPLESRQGKVVLADYVSKEDGTGLVHTAPGFGTEDYATGKKYGLELVAPVDARGRFAGLPKEVEQFNGRQVQEANPAVIQRLEELGLLVKSARVEHTYPHCWRCRKPIIFRATDQWFLKIEDSLREKLLAVAQKEVAWIPPFGRERMSGMLKTRPDWCLSRQRLWGIPIPAVLCAGCGEGILDPRVIEALAAAAEKEPEGVDRWFTEGAAHWLPAGFSCLRCKGTEFRAGADILDVWFDSGVSHRAVLKRRPELTHPADLYLEGSDQHRGWFQVSLITATALTGHAPYRGVLTHGFVVDGQGRKMSKSLGNVIAPQEVVASMGADVLRLWVASSDYAEDVRLSPTILAQVSETYRKIRNTVRFCLANVSDLSPERHPRESGDLNKVPGRPDPFWERWILLELRALAEEVTEAYDAYAFHRVAKAVHEFCTVRLSNFYLDAVKDLLYTAAPKDPGRVSVQIVLQTIARTLIRLLAPILPVTAEEAWGSLGEKESVHLQDWPRADALPEDPRLREEGNRLLGLRDQAMGPLERAREAGLIGDALEARLEIVIRDAALWDFLEPRRKELAAACIVSELAAARAKGEGPPVEFKVTKAAGQKCQRCWMCLPTVGRSVEHPGLCHRCAEVLRKLALDGRS